MSKRAIKRLIQQTDYKNFEIILLSKAEARASARAEIVWLETALADARASAFAPKVISCNKASVAERFNAAAAQTDGEILCFVDINLKPLSKDWLAELVSFACQTEIGAVGAKLLYKDETVRHGGLVVGIKGALGIAHHHLPRDGEGNFLRARLVNNFSAVSVSCLTVRREVFESVGGFDGKNLPNQLFDADFCLKLREKNYRIVFTPYAELIQTGEKKRLNTQKNPTAGEKSYFIQKWNEFIKRDPFYNPNLSYESEDFSIDI